MTIDHRWQQQYLKTGTYEHEISRGNVRGAYPMASYGKVVLGGATNAALIRDQDGVTLAVPQSVQLTVVSTSANDAAAGTGARTVVIEYLNGSLDLSMEVLTLNGTTPVTTVATDVRWVNSVYVSTAGTSGAAAGQISITHNSVVYARIIVGDRCTHNSFKRVPRGKMLYISSIYAGSASGSADTTALVELVSTQIDGLDQQETGLYYKQAGISLQDSAQSITFNMPFPITSGHIVGYIATVDKGATITAGFTGWVE